jgi:hypothetical protein
LWVGDDGSPTRCFMATAKIVAEMLSAATDKQGRLLPPVSWRRAVSVVVATAATRQAQADGVASIWRGRSRRTKRHHAEKRNRARPKSMAPIDTGNKTAFDRIMDVSTPRVRRGDSDAPIAIPNSARSNTRRLPRIRNPGPVQIIRWRLGNRLRGMPMRQLKPRPPSNASCNWRIQ